MLILYIYRYIYIYIYIEREREREREQRSNLLLVNAITRRAIISFFPLRTNLIITSNKVGTHNNKLKTKISNNNPQPRCRFLQWEGKNRKTKSSINLPLLNKEFTKIFSRTNAKDTKPLKIQSSRITTNICDAIVDFDNNNKKRYHQVGLSI